MNSCLPTTSSTMNQPPPLTRQTCCSSCRTRTPLACSMALRWTPVSLTGAAANDLAGKIACCAWATVRYRTANADGATSAETGKATKANSAFTVRLKVDAYSETHVIFFVLIAKDVTVVRGKLFVILAKCLPDWQLMKE